MKAWILAALIAATSVSVYSYDNALYDMAPDKRGAFAAGEFLSVFKKVVAKTTIDDQIKELNDFIYESASKFSIEKLYNSGYLKPLAHGYMGVTAIGKDRPDSYYLTMIPPKSAADKTPERGGFISEFGLKQIDESKVGGRSYLAYADIRANTMQMSDKSTIALNEGCLKVIDPVNFQNLQALRTRQDRHIKMEALMVLKEFFSKFPNLAKIIQVYTFPYHSDVGMHEHEGKKYTRQTFRVFLRLDALKKDYPHLTEYLESFRNLFRSEITGKNTSGNTLFKFAMESQKDIITVSVFTRESKIIPFDDQGLPVFSEEFLISQLTDIDFTTHGDLFTNVFGIKFTTENINVKAHYHSEPGKGKLSLRLTNIDKTHLFGKAESGVPAWVKDITLPENVDQFIFGFSRILVEANNGEGTILNLEWDTTDPENVIFHLRGSTEFLDNFYIRFAAATIKYCFRTSGEASVEMDALLMRTLNAIILDTNIYVEKQKSAMSKTMASMAGG